MSSFGNERSSNAPGLGGNTPDVPRNVPAIGTRIDYVAEVRNHIYKYGAGSDFFHSRVYDFLQDKEVLIQNVLADIDTDANSYPQFVKSNAIPILEHLVWNNEENQLQVIRLIRKLGDDYLNSYSDEMGLSPRAIETMVRSLHTTEYDSVRMELLNSIEEYALARGDYRNSATYTGNVARGTKSKKVLEACMKTALIPIQIYEDLPLEERKGINFDLYEALLDVVYGLNDLDVAFEAVNLIDAKLQHENLCAYQMYRLRSHISHIALVFNNEEFTIYTQALLKKYPNNEQELFRQLKRDWEEIHIFPFLDDED